MTGADSSVDGRSGERAAVPFGEFVLKVHGGCQLSCDYCYMYESVGAWDVRTRPMRRQTLTQACRRIAEHAREHDLARVRVVFHGGEPLLSGAAALSDAAARLRYELGTTVEADVTVQTNGLLIDDRSLPKLAAAGIRVGVSVDGGPVANDRHRRFRDGRGSHDRVAGALRLLQDHPGTYAGVLAVVDLDNDPIETYESLLAYGPPRMDFLLPHGNWESPPPGRRPDEGTPYADWLIPVFDRWYSAPRAETGIRFFEDIIAGLLGGHSRTESIGTSPVGVVVVDVDGAMEQVDALRTAYPGAVDTALNVFDNSFDDALDHHEVRERQQGADSLSATCRSCPIVAVCGGGYYPHRYGANGTKDFNAPSVYCRDLFKLIDHVAARVRADVARIVRHTRHAGTHDSGG